MADGPGISDGDLVRLARDGDPVAFRLLVERHQPMVRARAAGLCANASDVDDIMQEVFLRAFIALDRLREPDRFAGWLASCSTCAAACGAAPRSRCCPTLPSRRPPPHSPFSLRPPTGSRRRMTWTGPTRCARRWPPCLRGSGAPFSCTTTLACPPGRSATRPARPG